MLIEISGKKYRLPQLDVFQQFALASTISPILTLLSFQEDRSKLSEKFPQAFTMLTGEMSLTREAKDEIIRMCLSGVARQEGGAFAPVMVNGRMMYQDMSLDVVLGLIFQILLHHKLFDFFSATHSSSVEQEQDHPSSGSITRKSGS